MSDPRLGKQEEQLGSSNFSNRSLLLSCAKRFASDRGQGDSNAAQSLRQDPALLLDWGLTCHVAAARAASSIVAEVVLVALRMTR